MDAQRKVLAFRWSDPVTNRKRQADARAPLGDELKHDRVFKYSGPRAGSRGLARLLAVKLSMWLARERLVNELRKTGDHRVVAARGGKLSWADLRAKHCEALQTAGSAVKTVKCYEQAWRFLDGWLGKGPLWPHEAQCDDLRSFVRFLLDYRTKWGEPLPSSSIASHVKGG